MLDGGRILQQSRASASIFFCFSVWLVDLCYYMEIAQLLMTWSTWLNLHNITIILEGTPVPQYAHLPNFFGLLFMCWYVVVIDRQSIHAQMILCAIWFMKTCRVRLVLCVLYWSVYRYWGKTDCWNRQCGSCDLSWCWIKHRFAAGRTFISWQRICQSKRN